MNKVILILIDGLGYQTSVDFCGYLEARVAAGSARRTRIVAELPSMSRPLYETVHTGVPPVSTGSQQMMCPPDNDAEYFPEVRGAGGSTAAAAFCWFSSFTTSAFRPDERGHPDGCDGQRYPARPCSTRMNPFRTGKSSRGIALAHAYQPDYLLLHPMASDHIGHRHGGGFPTVPDQRHESRHADSGICAGLGPRLPASW